jgi:hypothetical protein
MFTRAGTYCTTVMNITELTILLQVPRVLFLAGESLYHQDGRPVDCCIEPHPETNHQVGSKSCLSNRFICLHVLLQRARECLGADSLRPP